MGLFFVILPPIPTRQPTLVRPRGPEEQATRPLRRCTPSSCASTSVPAFTFCRSGKFQPICRRGPRPPFPQKNHERNVASEAGHIVPGPAAFLTGVMTVLSLRWPRRTLGKPPEGSWRNIVLSKGIRVARGDAKGAREKFRRPHLPGHGSHSGPSTLRGSCRVLSVSGSACAAP